MLSVLYFTMTAIIELIIFVYPLSFQEQTAQCIAKTSVEFKLVLDDCEEKQKIRHEPLWLFDTEDFISLLHMEQGIGGEE